MSEVHVLKVSRADNVLVWLEISTVFSRGMATTAFAFLAVFVVVTLVLTLGAFGHLWGSLIQLRTR